MKEFPTFMDGEDCRECAFFERDLLLLERRIDAVRKHMIQMKDKAQLTGDSTIVKMLDLFCIGINAALDEPK